MKVLFVCTGNICRSPIAHRMLERYGEENKLRLEVSSAGTRALNGAPMHVESRRALRLLGFEPGDFESRMLTPAIAADCDLLLGMTRQHRAAARQLAPTRWRRMLTLREIAMETGSETVHTSRAVDPTAARLDIRDPVGRSAEVFNEVAKEIAASVQALTVWIETHSTGGTLIKPSRSEHAN
ncbi:arsenate reductase/protein-tyrosine-phosphatase family protein [Gordonia rubripertincta]|uniref:arsenate reductase/protein-tyrosine-phosphatase family protein n=1 Tax=Gordonia rubripertincta TaxID=36822 RepID=UPI0035B388A3